MKIFVSELKDGDFITEQAFSVEEIQQHKTRNQNPYYRLILQDKTGEIVARIWENDFSQCNLRDVESGDVVQIDAEVNNYKGNLQLIIKKLQKTEDYDITDLLQASTRDIEKMFTTLQSHIANVQTKPLQTLLHAIFKDKIFVRRYKRAPAAEKIHHDFIGGLLEHTLEMLDLAKALYTYYKEADQDLANAGIILHDIGKVFELDVKKTQLIRTTEGRLIGHVIQGIDFINTKRPKDFPDDLWMKLEHIIIAHQGELAFGSPVRPATIEAAIVHVVDYASSHVRQFHKAITLGEGQNAGFSDYQKWIGTQVYLD